jgi:tRNA G18 (ribose-2'-O)-methylase SpoU
VRKLKPQEIATRRPANLARLTRAPLAIVLDDIRSAWNVGSILRTADAVRAEHVYCCGYTPAPDHAAVRKTALGAEASVPWSVVTDALDAVASLRQRGFRLAALEQTDEPTRLADVGADAFPLALVLGNEVTGVQQRVLDACNFAIELPQFGAKLSLNVSVAFGVAAYGLMDCWMARQPGLSEGGS